MVNVYKELLNSYVAGSLSAHGLGEACRKVYQQDLSSIESKTQGQVLVRGAVQLIEYGVFSLPISMDFPDGTTKEYTGADIAVAKVAMATDVSDNLETYYPAITS